MKDNSTSFKQFRQLSPAKGMTPPAIPSSVSSHLVDSTIDQRGGLQSFPSKTASKSPHMVWDQETQLIPASPSSPLSDQKAPTAQRSSRKPANLKKRNTMRISALCLIVLLCVTGFSLWRFVLHALPEVKLYRVSLQNASQDIGGGGIAYPAQRLDISYPFPSHILSVFVKPGDKVSPNEPLVQIDLSQVNAQNIAQLKAQVAQAYQNVLASETYLATVRRTGNAIYIAQAQQQYADAQARYNELVAEANAPSLHQGNIVSMFDGIVTSVKVFPGQLLAADKIILTIFDESSIIVRVQVALSNYGQVHINQTAQITPSALPNQNFTGAVMSLIPEADPKTGTFEVWIKVPNTTGDFLPGMSAFVRIHTTIRALVVPRLAVLNTDQDSNVFIVRNQHVFLQHVQVIGYMGDSLIIGAGLNANDLIVLVGLNTLQDGQAVHITGIEN